MKINNLKLYEKWILTWIVGLLFVWVWLFNYLNVPSFERVQSAFIESMMLSVTSVVFAGTIAWFFAMISVLSGYCYPIVHSLSFFLRSMISSVPQILTLFIGYTLMMFFIESKWAISIFSIVILSFVLFEEMVQLIEERVAFYKSTDMYQSLKVLGMKEFRIVNFHILWKNSLAHLINKLIAFFGMSLFLQTSIDYVISIGLSKHVNFINFPVTLGNLLSRIDSKQDILAMSRIFSDPSYFPNLFFEHLQGVSIVFLITFTLVSVYKISDTFTSYYEL